MATSTATSRPNPERIFNTLVAFHETAALKAAKAITLEFVPNEDRVTPPIAAAFSLVMLAGTDAGDPYAFAQYEKMLANAGFKTTSLHPVPEMPQQVLVSEK